MATADIPLTVHYQGERQDAHAISGLAHQGHRIEPAYQKRIVDAKLAGELAYFFRLVKSDPHELQTLRAIAILHSHEHGDFLTARSAPRRPEVDYQYPAAPALERLGLSLDIIQACGQEGQNGCRISLVAPGCAVAPDTETGARRSSR